jgi:diguanylate cyclase (GGDEF)-like protein
VTVALFAAAAAAVVAAIAAGWVAWRRARRRGARRLEDALAHELARVDSLSTELEQLLERFERAATLRRLVHSYPRGCGTAEVLEWAAETAAGIEHVDAGVVRVTDGSGDALVAAHGMPLEHARAQSIAWPYPTPRWVSFAFDYEGDGATLLRSGLAVPLRPGSRGEEFVAVFSRARSTPAAQLIQPLEALSERVATAIDEPRGDHAEPDAGAPSLGGGRIEFQRALAREVFRARRAATPLTLLLIDVDGLGASSRRLGPLHTDRILADVAAQVRVAAAEAVSFRVGGDAFAITAAGSGVTDAERILAALRASLQPIGMTVSAGIADLDDDDWLALLIHADRALQDAKAAGGDTAVVASARSLAALRAAPAIGAR